MAEFAELVLSAKTEGLKKAESDLKSLKTTGAQTEKAVGKSTTNINKGFDSVGMSAKRMAIGLVSVTAAITTASRALAASQVYVKMTNSLRALGMTADQSVAALDKIADVAKRTRAPLEATAQLYQRVSIAGKDLGASSKEVLRFTENVSLALAQTGGSAASASGALLQLSQAMSGGTVRAEEFNSILEGAFPIAQAAANAIEGAAGSVGKLRNMVIAGEISSKQFFDAIISQSAALEVAFANTVPTIGQAITVMGDSFIIAAGKMDAMLGVSSAIASGILLLAENLDRIAVYAAVAATALAVTYGGAALIAAARTITLAGAFTVLRRAIFATGIGAIIIGAGELVLWFSKLVKAAGGFGNAMVLLGEVAAAVWQGFVDSAAAIPPALNAVWEQMRGGFLIALSGMATSFFDFMWTIATGFNQVKGLESIGGQLMGIADAANEASGSLMSAGHSAKAAAEGSFASAAATISTSFDPARAAVEKLNGVMVETAGVTGDTGESINKINTALDGAGDASKGAGKAMKDAAKEAENFADEIERLEFDADPLKKYNAELAELNKIMATGDLSSGAYEKAVKDLNEEFANSNPNISKIGDAIGDFVVGGMRDFGSLLDSFKNMIKQMIATAIANPIKLALTTAFAGGGTASAAGVPGGGILGGGGGLLGGIGGGIGALTGGLGAGFSMATSGLLSGGLGGLTSVISTQVGAATASIGAFGAAIGAIALPVAAVAAVFSFFKKKTKELDSGLRITADSMGTLVEQFTKTETKRFWGLSKKVRETYSPTENAEPIMQAVDAIRDETFRLGSVLGLVEDNFNSFAYSIRLSLKGLSEDEAQARIAETFGEITAEYAYAALGHFQELMGDVIRDGQTADQALSELAGSLQGFNAIMGQLRLTTEDASVAGAVAARNFADMFGGLDALNQVATIYYQNFYSDAERLGHATALLTEQMSALYLTVPDTIAGFRALVDAADAAGDREMVAALLQISPLFAEVKDAISGTADTQQALTAALTAYEQAVGREIARLQSEANTVLEPLLAGISAAETGANDARSALDGAMNSLRSFVQAQISAANDAADDAITPLQDEIEAFATASENAAERLEAAFSQVENNIDAQISAIEAASASAVVALQDELRSLEAAADETSAAVQDAFAALEQAVSSDIAAIEDDLSAAIEALADTATAARDLADAAQSSFDAVYQALTESLDQQGDQITAFYDGQIGTLTDAFAAASDAMNETVATLESAATAARDLADEARVSMDAVYQALTASLDQQAIEINAFYNVQISTITDAMGSAGGAASNFAAMLGDIESVLSSRRIEGAASELLRYRDAQEQLARFAAGAAYTQDQLSGALGGVSQPSEQFFGSRFDYEKDFAKTTANLKALRDQAAGQVSEGQQQIDLLSVQITALETLRDQELAAIEEQRAQATALYDATVAILTGQGNVNGTLSALQSAAAEALTTAQNAAAVEASTDNQIAELRTENEAQSGILQSQVALLQVMRDQELAAITEQRAQADAIYNVTSIVSGTLEALRTAAAQALTTAQNAAAVEESTDTQITALRAQAQIQIAALNAILQSNNVNGETALGTNAAVAQLTNAVAADTTAQNEMNARQTEITAEIAGLNESATAQVALLNDQLATAQDQYNAALGIDAAITDVDASIAAMQSAIAEYGQAQSSYLATLSENSESIASIEAARDAQIAALNAQLDTAQAIYDTATGQAVTLTSIDAHMGAFNATLAEYTAAQVTLADVMAINQPLIDSINATLAEQTGILETQLASFQDQLAPLNNLPTALATLQAAIQALADAQANVVIPEAPQSLLAAQLDTIYNRTLNRDADASGAAYYTGQVLGGSKSLADVEAEILASQEFRNSIFRPQLDAAYQAGVGRAADQSGADWFYQQFMGGRSMADIAADIASSPESMGIPSYATGTSNHPGGLAMVGERGPELVNMPSGSSVSTAPATRKMFDNSDLIAEVRALRSDMHSIQEENRTLQLQLVRYTRKTADINEQWDGDGLPAERTA